MTSAQIKDLGDTVRKPQLPPGTLWMLRCMEASGIPDSGKWVEIEGNIAGRKGVGWEDVGWGNRPNSACPIFTSDNVKDEFHWDLYKMLTSSLARDHWCICALVQVHLEPDGSFVSTGIMRFHKNLPVGTGDNCFHLCRRERDAWEKRSRPRGLLDSWKEAYDILRQILEKGHVDQEGDFLLGDVWPDEGHPAEPSLIKRALELYDRSEAGPVTISRS